MELHHGGHFFQQFAQLGVAAGLVGEQVVDEDEADILRQVLEHLFQSVPPALILEQVVVVDQDHRPLAHHGQGVHAVRQGLDVQLFPLELVEIEGLHPFREQLFLHLLDIIVP